MKRRNVSKLTKATLFNKQKGKCNLCSDKLKIPFVTDHIIPLELGGSDNEENLQLLCWDCDLIKTSKDLLDIWEKRKSKKKRNISVT